VISSRPAEGKSLTALALAKSLHRSGRRVLLIDGDMRSPSVNYLMEIDGAYGLSNYLAGNNDITSLIQSGHDGLNAMAAGPQPPSAAELLASERLGTLLSALRADYDCVIIDSPPVLGLADAPLVGSRVEGCIFVTEAHATKKGVVKVALSRLRAARANIFGVVLSKFDPKLAHYGYGYNYGYGYSYGADTGSE
jgi:capsular exopolysaccharide synthesis family protein